MKTSIKFSMEEKGLKKFFKVVRNVLIVFGIALISALNMIMVTDDKERSRFMDLIGKYYDIKTREEQCENSSMSTGHFENKTLSIAAC